MDYLIILICIFILPVSAQIYINYNYKKYSKTDNRNQTGFDTARKILDSNGLDDIYIVETSGFLSDHYDPKINVVRLSQNIFNDSSVSSMAVSAHECGHALQNKDGYFFLKIRSFLVPIVNISAKFAYILLILSFVLEYYNLFTLAIILLSLGVLFQLITLPVEFNASKRAKEELLKLGLANDSDIVGVNKVLNAAALTYVAGLLASLAQMLRLILIFNRRD